MLWAKKKRTELKPITISFVSHFADKTKQNDFGPSVGACGGADFSTHDYRRYHCLLFLCFSVFCLMSAGLHLSPLSSHRYLNICFSVVQSWDELCAL
jgi:hypothetical protein